LTADLEIASLSAMTANDNFVGKYRDLRLGHRDRPGSNVGGHSGERLG
jgi:hypothetical protein